MMDDILVFGKDIEQHDRRLKEVLRILEEAGLTLKKRKCEFEVREILFLGHHIGENAITEIKSPTCKKELIVF